MPVSLTGETGVRPFYRIGAWRNDDRRVRTVSGDGLIGRVAVIGAIGRELIDRHVDLVEQWPNLRGVAAILVRHDVCDDITAVGIQRQVQLAPAPTGFGAMLFLQPLARALDLQPGTVDEDVKWCIWRSPSFGRWHPGCCPSAEGRVIGHGQIQSHQLKHRTQKPFALAQSQAENQSQRQSSLDRQIRIAWLATACRALRRPPARQASAVIHSVRLPRRRRPTSYSGQFVSLNFILPTRWRRETLCLKGIVAKTGYCDCRPPTLMQLTIRAPTPRGASLFNCLFDSLRSATCSDAPDALCQAGVRVRRGSR